jgi:hypothetical protein
MRVWERNNLSLHGAHKYGFVPAMKTTLEIPDTVFRRAKTQAASRGVTFREFVTEAVREKLALKKGSRENKPGVDESFRSCETAPPGIAADGCIDRSGV